MQFEDFLRHRLTQPLPGIDAHRELIPDIPDKESRLHPPPEGARQSAVLVPLITRPHTFPDVLFTLRSENLRSHRGQISFPGGRVDEGEEPIQAALRELFEETGVPIKAVQVLGTLTPIYIPPSNSSVIPVVGIIERPNDYTISEAEVREIFDVPLLTFMNPESMLIEPRAMYGTTVDVPHWRVHPDVMLWGATAMILNELVWISRDFVSNANS